LGIVFASLAEVISSEPIEKSSLMAQIFINFYHFLDKHFFSLPGKFSFDFHYFV